MGLAQGLLGVSTLLGGAGMFIYAITGLANMTLDGESGFGWAFSGVIALILGAILIKTN